MRVYSDKGINEQLYQQLFRGYSILVMITVMIAIPMTKVIATNIIWCFHIHYLTWFSVATHEIDKYSFHFSCIHCGSENLPKILKQVNCKNNSYVTLCLFIQISRVFQFIMMLYYYYSYYKTF